MPPLEVKELLQPHIPHFELTLVAGKRGLNRPITVPRIQKPGLALIGDTSALHAGRIQVLGKAEITYLKSLPDPKKEEIIRKICEANVACFVITRNNEPPPLLVTLANKKKIPLFKTTLITSTFINRLTRFLDEQLTTSITLHGVMVDVFGVGILIIGKSGIGKSECALDLIHHGHRLVADDIVEIKKRSATLLYGSSSGILINHIEIRGSGILNIRDLFGIAAICDQKRLQIVVELVEWSPNQQYDRLGIDEYTYTILDIAVPYLKIPVSPGRNISTIIEVAARNQLLKEQGHYSSKIFERQLNQTLRQNAKIAQDLIEE